MPIVAVFGSSTAMPDDPRYRMGVDLGKAIAAKGWTVANGGYGGMMEAVSSGARESGGEVIGVTAPPVFPGRHGVNSFVTSEVTTSTISERIHRLIDLSDASVALPGSLGTFAELVVAWNDGFVAPFRGVEPKPVIALGPGWRSIVAHAVELVGASADFINCVDEVPQVTELLSAHFEKF